MIKSEDISDEMIQLARAELNELRKITYRGRHPQKHLFECFDWMEKKIADDAAKLDIIAKVDERLTAFERRLDAKVEYEREQGER